MRCGIVGLPNVGKSSLFNAITHSSVPSENYPFCTIDPNVGIVSVPDSRLQPLSQLVGSETIIPATVEFVDIAGLVKGASQGEGLGNAFLTHIREVDVLVQVVRCFVKDTVIHVLDRVDPIGDIEIIETELLLADLQTVQDAKERFAKKSKKEEDGIIHMDFFRELEVSLSKGFPARTFTFPHISAPHWMKSLSLLTAKKVLYVANVLDHEISGNQYSTLLIEYAKKQNADCVIISSVLEAELSLLEKTDKIEFMKELGVVQSGLDTIIQHCYSLLGLQTYFTAGEKEVRAWTVRAGAKAPEAAGRIHTDFEKGFIRAEVIAYQDFISFGGEHGAKQAGVWRLEGKEYVVQEGDIMHFRFAPA
ncbi:MAG: redox-regulated ATPase YchF [Methylacidiphilales bacterium]|nr:redox-regulated ATPase YchF [Candidatus Methylacidiphilales bacterium]